MARSTGPSRASWSPPPKPLFKLNVDASVVPGERHGGIGGIIRDHMGRVITGFAKPAHCFYSVDHLEALAMFHGLKFAEDIGINELQADGYYNLRVIAAVNRGRQDLSELGLIFAEINLACGRFKSCSFAHVKRDANGAAHNIAVFSWCAESEVFWIEELPVRFSEALEHDVVGSAMPICILKFI